MKTIKHLLLAALLALAAIGQASAANGNADEAKALVEQAIAHIHEVGSDKAFVDFSAPGGKWHEKDLYLFAYKMDGTNVAHGANRALIGKNLLELKTADGQLLIKGMADLVKSKGKGWIDYQWPHPETKKTEAKSAWVKKIPDYDGFVGCGIYK
jgi:signal transduction histidine kinase